MPVTRSRTGVYDASLDQTNTTRFLFGEDEPSALGFGTVPDENFPTLIRRDDHIVSLSPLAILIILFLFGLHGRFHSSGFLFSSLTLQFHELPKWVPAPIHGSISTSHSPPSNSRW